jgi:hypothetical protein
VPESKETVMKSLASVLASAILLTVASSNFAAAELKLDSRHDIEPAAQTTPVETTGKTAAAEKPAQTKYQTAAADAQAAVPPKPAKPRAKAKPRPRYVEETVLVVRPFRPVFRPAFRPAFRFGGRW